MTDERLKELRALCEHGGQPGPCCDLAVLRVAGPHPAPCTREHREVRRFYVADVLALLDEVTRTRGLRPETARLLLEGASGIEMNHYERCVESDRCECEADAQAARDLAGQFSKEPA